MEFLPCLLYFWQILLIKNSLAIIFDGIVETNNGLLQGKVEENFTVFYGIPYSQPPIGKFRWQKPRNPLSWSGIRDATDIYNHASCVQRPDSDEIHPISEDCLYLNIWMPRKSKIVDPDFIETEYEQGNYTPRPVLFWIHGGRFINGDGTILIYDGRKIAAAEGVIVVTINYRLGGFGFMFDEDSQNLVPGNQGLWDQLKALEWIKKNIHHFYGDPDQITIFGESAGAQSVASLLSMREINKRERLFKKAIIQSNPMGIQFKNKHSAQDLSDKFLENIGCNRTIYQKESWNCARDIEYEIVYNVTSSLIASNVDDEMDLRQFTSLFETWSPMIDGDLLDLHPIEALYQGRAIDKHIIAGHTSGEGATFVYALFQNPIGKLKYEKAVELYFHKNETVINKILEQYPSCRATDRNCDMRGSISAIMSAYVFNCPLRQSLKRRAKLDGNRSSLPSLSKINAYLPGKTFRYIFDHPNVLIGEVLQPIEIICSEYSCHTAELPFIFQSFDLLKTYPDPKELELSKAMIKYWSNFAWNGDPSISVEDLSQLKDEIIDRRDVDVICWEQFLDNPEITDSCGNPEFKPYHARYLITTDDVNERDEYSSTPLEVDIECNFWDSLDIYLKY